MSGAHGREGMGKVSDIAATRRPDAVHVHILLVYLAGVIAVMQKASLLARPWRMHEAGWASILRKHHLLRAERVASLPRRVLLKPGYCKQVIQEVIAAEHMKTLTHSSNSAQMKDKEDRIRASQRVDLPTASMLPAGIPVMLLHNFIWKMEFEVVELKNCSNEEAYRSNPSSVVCDTSHRIGVLRERATTNDLIVREACILAVGDDEHSGALAVTGDGTSTMPKSAGVLELCVLAIGDDKQGGMMLAHQYMLPARPVGAHGLKKVGPSPEPPKALYKGSARPKAAA
ncbi:hypothetical protein EDD15DRAFT_2195893 [Pisolithus albus]|nr:hypothetical protein EDD15DRAFT_2195893 [Pisolithus albus]